MRKTIFGKFRGELKRNIYIHSLFHLLPRDVALYNFMSVLLKLDNLLRRPALKKHKQYFYNNNKLKTLTEDKLETSSPISLLFQLKDSGLIY